MPEGDAVFRSCAQLHRALAGRALTRAELRVPQAATARLVGREVLEVVPRGKHQLTRLSDGLTVHTHLRMDGVWKFAAAGARLPGPAFQIRALLGNQETTAVGLRLGMVDLVRTADEHTLVGHLGPDLLGPDWDAELAVANLLREPERSIGEALLDQRNLAGIGTIYRAESLFAQRVNPRTPAGRVEDLTALVERARTLLSANLEGRWKGTTGSTAPGARRWVYDRAGRPCPRCGTPVACETYGPPTQERLSWWCPRCQPLPPGVEPAGPAPRPRAR
ncbi:Fpg/Nei family DNA glycosylase [Luteococcus peritonei]|uniref:DNA-(apurinic or apyrimidinic site) lyase n=1 Tax=Luteococcus peritonei TaxID=88874 RepID=A0ABW4RYT7_9ACTN